MIKLVKNPHKYYVIKWHTQAGNMTTKLKVKVDFKLTALSATNVVTCECLVDEFTKGRYDMILGRYLLT